ncbi:MAG TPA: SusD/RagB family nutrient-binding outer membrane lipoprotein, partial [Porphyromonadaceae bacterium]|nr:SusD/RagB family nutrient-binding outer membrane lipoprotein [Porphyromonadaceae bacterium]
ISGVCVAGSLLFASCTDHFKDWNINPNEVTSEQMEYDNLNTGAYFTQMEKGVFIVGKGADGIGLGGRYQVTEMLTGDIFASYIANINTYSYTTYHNDHYALYR